MSIFLPEQSTPQDTVDLSSGTPESTQADVALMQRVFAAAMRSPNLIPEGFMSYVLDWIQTQRLSIPIGQVFGFSQFTAQVATQVDTFESTTSTSFTDLTTRGPEITSLAAGNYLVIFGAQAGGSASTVGPTMGFATPTDAASDALSALTFSTVLTSIVGVAVVRLASNDSNILAQYKAQAAGTASFQRRFLMALRYSNL